MGADSGSHVSIEIEMIGENVDMISKWIYVGTYLPSICEREPNESGSNVKQKNFL